GEDPLLQAARSISIDTGTRLKLAAEAAPKVEPDRYAQAKRAAQPRGLTAEAVLPELDALQRDDLLSKIAAEQPDLAEFLAQPGMHAVASDDYENLSALHKTLYGVVDTPRQLVSEVARYPGTVLRGVGELYTLGER